MEKDVGKPRRSGLVASVFIFISAIISGIAHAEWRCDCTRIADSCSANVTVEGNWVSVTSDKQECSRVDYFVDGQPFVTVVVDGEDRQDWLSRTSDPAVLIKSCQVCQDNLLHEIRGASEQDVQTGDTDKAVNADDSATTPTVIIRLSPGYPPEAGNLSGHVVVEFDVDAYGDVRNPRIIEAQPAGIFDKAALTAVSRWKFSPGIDIDGDSIQLQERFDFSPSATSATGSNYRSQGYRGVWRAGLDTRNHCVKEGDQQDFVDMREIELVNVCQNPVVVYSCVQGSAASSGLWLCNSDNDVKVSLVRSGDSRSGQQDRMRTANGITMFTYAENALIYPAAGTQYWWVACNIDDLYCRDAAQAWSDSLEHSPASVDPRRGFAIAVAGSY